MMLVLFFLLCVLALSLILTLTMYSIWYYERQSHPGTADIGCDDGELTLAAVLRGVFLESLANLWMLLSSPLVSWWEGRKKLPAGDGVPVLLVHGYSCNRGCMGLLAWRLRRAGYRVRCVSYMPSTANVGRLVPQVKEHILQLLDDSGSDMIHYVAHSMGGVLVRDALSDSVLANTVGKVICLGSPHQGSRAANLVAVMARGAARQLVYRSAYVDGLPLRPGGAEYYGICSPMDALVLPSASAVLPGATTQVVPDLGHCSLLYSRRVAEQVLAMLAEA